VARAPSPVSYPEAAYDEAGGEAPAEVPSVDFLTSTAYAAETKRQIIYTATMTVEAKDVESAMEAAEGLIDEYGGWLSSKDSHADADGNITGSITLRVPAARFEAAMAALRALGDVRSERVDSQDVTSQFVDLQARLKNLKREEEVVARLYERQGKIADVLQVERELARVRGEIEQIEAQLRSLGEQVAYSTISVSLVPVPSAIEQRISRWDLGHHILRAWKALAEVARALVLALIYIGIVAGPFIVLIWLVWRVIRAVRPNNQPPQSPPVELPPPTAYVTDAEPPGPEPADASGEHADRG